MPDSCKATVITWGTTPGAGRMSAQIARKLFKGGNHGHSAIKLTFPVDPRGEQLIKDYCQSSSTKPLTIPHTKVVSIDPTTNIAKEHYEVYFSINPLWIECPEFLSHYDKDKASQIKGIHVKRSGEDPAYIPKRKLHSVLRSRDITLAPMATIDFSKIDGGKDQVAKYDDRVLQDQLYRHLIYPEGFPIQQKDRDKLYINIILLAVRLLNIYDYSMGEFNHFTKQLQKLKEKDKDQSKKKSLEHIDKQKQELENKIEEHRQAMLDNQKIFELLEGFFLKHFNSKEANLQDVINLGREPDHTIDLPVVDFANTIKDVENVHGLDLEKMLAMMRNILDDKVEFNIFNKNCSSTCLKIINAGIMQEDRDWMASKVPQVTENYKDQDISFLFVSSPFNVVTPQRVYNSTIQLQKNLSKKGDALLFLNTLQSNKKKNLSVEGLIYFVEKIKKFFINISKKFNKKVNKI